MPEKRQRGRPRGFTDKTEQNTIRSLDRAMSVLEALSELAGPTLTELSQELDQSPATIYRILITLQTRGIVELDAGSQTWHVGPKAFLIGSSFLRRTGLIERSRPVMRRLMELTGETANLGIERQGQVLFISQIETNETIRAFFPPGTNSPLHASGIGKALLANYSQIRLDKVLSFENLQRFTPTTLVERDALCSELLVAQSLGYATDNEERTQGMRCIAAAIFDAYGEPIAGVSISGPTSRVKPQDVARLGQAVFDAAHEISVSMGAREI